MTRRWMTRRFIGTAVPVTLLILGTAFFGATRLSARQGAQLVRGNKPGEWRYWGADAWSTRYSALDQINATNFDSLQVAWQWNAGTYGEDEYYRTTPLYAERQAAHRGDDAAQTRSRSIPRRARRSGSGASTRAFAGRRRRANSPAADSRIGRTARRSARSSSRRAIISRRSTRRRGRATRTSARTASSTSWKDSAIRSCRSRSTTRVRSIISEAAPARKAKPGEKWNPVTKTGADGTMGIDPAQGQIAQQLAGDRRRRRDRRRQLVDARLLPAARLHNIPGFIRGFDVHTGKQLWKFNLIPQPGEFGAETWKNGSKIGTIGVGKNDAWATYSADPELGLVYIPVGEGLSDEYGGYRPGNNLFANSVVAIDAKTGKRKWHFQFVHHDIWDYDTPMAPNLLDVTINGQPRKIIAATTKQGWVYVLDRVTGQPIWPMPETPVLQSEVPGEQTSPTQPIPTRPEPYAQQGLMRDRSHRLHAGDQRFRIEARSEVPHGSVLHSGLARRRQGRQRSLEVPLLLVRARRGRRREHRRRHGGRSRNRHDLRRRPERPRHDRSGARSVFGAPLQPTARQLRSARRAAAAESLRHSGHRRGCVRSRARRRRSAASRFSKRRRWAASRRTISTVARRSGGCRTATRGASSRRTIRSSPA